MVVLQVVNQTPFFYSGTYCVHTFHASTALAGCSGSPGPVSHHSLATSLSAAAAWVFIEPRQCLNTAPFGILNRGTPDHRTWLRNLIGASLLTLIPWLPRHNTSDPFHSVLLSPPNSHTYCQTLHLGLCNSFCVTHFNHNACFSYKIQT